MDLEDVQRKVQFRQGSYTVTIPLQIIHALGIRKNQYVRFAVSNKKVIIKPVEATITKKDLTEAEKDSAVLDKYDRPQMMGKYEEDENTEYMDEIADIISRDTSDSCSSSSSRMEKLRMK